VPVLVGATAGQLGVGAIFATVAGMLAASAGYVIRERRALVAENSTWAAGPAPEPAES
jgi:hypothetical protein